MIVYDPDVMPGNAEETEIALPNSLPAAHPVEDDVPNGMSTYSMLLEGPTSTVCVEAPQREMGNQAYQSEAELEDDLLGRLVAQGYERVYLKSEEELLDNARSCIEALNPDKDTKAAFRFTDGEWKRFKAEHLCNPTMGVIEKAELIQRQRAVTFKLDTGADKNIHLIDPDHIFRNKLQVMNQFEMNDGLHKNRYDVTILVNGLPLVQIELKRRGVQLKQAFNQIERYRTESYWSGSGLFEFIQVFVISNGTHTKYYSNTVRYDHTHPKRGQRGAASFEFTSWWSDSKNRRIEDLERFSATFLSKGTLLMVLTHYCVLTAEEPPKLLVMRPYQISATEKVLNRILISENDKRRLGTLAAGGYIWHTTGSGKTLTSFKCAQLASAMDLVDKVLFVVDRKDLDYQTMKEYNRFQQDAVNGSENTRALEKNLADPTAHICVTTIQKLSVLLGRNAKLDVYNKHVVFIFDECHRSQFGKMHKLITSKFKNYHLFGFTGTPIFAKNAGSSGDVTLRTTQQAFGDMLHAYTIVNAINDGNVLPFRIDYLSTMHAKSGISDEKVHAIDKEAALLAPERIMTNATYVLDHFDQQTMRTSTSQGFSAILATQSIQMARAYYQAICERQAEREAAGTLARKLKVAMIYSYAPNGDDASAGIISDESMATDKLSASDRSALDAAIANYNQQFATSFSTDNKGFDNYYKDISQRLKKRELDLLIVVDMFLAGFDAKTLNTLWVDKNLRMHGLIQAFSRTNRILDDVKSFGNIVCFRDLSHEVDEALSLFGDPNAGGLVLLKDYRFYFERYCKLIDLLRSKFLGPDGGWNIVGEQAEAEFVKLFSAVLRELNVLTVFEQFAADDPLKPLEFQNLRSIYLDLYDSLIGPKRTVKVDIVRDLVFEITLLSQRDVTIDYILELVAKSHADNVKDKVLFEQVMGLVASSPQLRDKRELIMNFLEHMGISEDGSNPQATADDQPAFTQLKGDARYREVGAQWQRFLHKEMEAELSALINQLKLKADETRELMSFAFENGGVPETGVYLSRCLPTMSRFGATRGKNRSEVRARALIVLQDYYDKYCNLVRSYPADTSRNLSA